MRVCMIGAGYVGLVSGACFAEFGHHVTCIDKDARRIAALNAGEIPIFEPGLAELVDANVRQGRLDFAAETTSVAEADAVFIAVGTPSRRGDGYADLSFVYQAVREIARLLPANAVVVTKSTVPVGTGDEIERILRELRPDAYLPVVSNPEFLREGAAIQDFKHPDRIVVTRRSRSVPRESIARPAIRRNGLGLRWARSEKWRSGAWRGLGRCRNGTFASRRRDQSGAPRNGGGADKLALGESAFRGLRVRSGASPRLRRRPPLLSQQCDGRVVGRPDAGSQTRLSGLGSPAGRIALLTRVTTSVTRSTAWRSRCRSSRRVFADAPFGPWLARCAGSPSSLHVTSA